jgi:hypothetical protein
VATPREKRYAAYMGFMIGLGIALVILLGGCATQYEVKVCHEDTVTCSFVNVKSYREFNQPNIRYVRDGSGVDFTFGAEDAITGTSPVEQAVADVIRSSPQLILPPVPRGGAPQQ